jgi:hypothetical protein
MFLLSQSTSKESLLCLFIIKYRLWPCYDMQVTFRIVLCLFSITSVHSQCCVGSGNLPAPANTAAACTANAGGGTWSLMTCLPSTQCLGYKCTVPLNGVNIMIFAQSCTTSQSLNTAMRENQVAGASCSITGSNASVLKAIPSPLVLVMTLLISASALVLISDY